MSSSSPRRALAWLRCAGRRSCSATNSGACGRAPRSSGARLRVGARPRDHPPSATATAACAGVLRYAPTHDHAPKMLAVRGSQLGLIPYPTAELSNWIVVTEGPPDMISARSRGLPAVAVPGGDAWEPGWAQVLGGRHVSVVLDCDHAGRAAAERIVSDLKAAGVRASVVELGRHRQDGDDLTDWLDERCGLAPERLFAVLGAPATGRPRSAYARGR